MSLTEFQTQDGDVRIGWLLERALPEVWSHLLDVGHLPEWLGVVVEGAFDVGRTLVVDHGDGYLCRSDIERVDALDSLAMAWHFPDEPPSRVSISLCPATSGSEPPASREGTRLQLRHSGLGGLVGEYVAGWITHLTFFEASLGGAPMPSSAFWPLCGTNAKLTSP